MNSQVLEFRLCPHCTALIPVDAGRCARCKMSATEATPLRSRRSRLKRTIADLRARRYARQSIATGLCPNCREVIAHDARRCSGCDWIKVDGKRHRISERHRRLARSVRAALTYERIVFCTHCVCNVRSTTNFCPSCQNPFLPGNPRPSLQSRIGAHVRRRWARNALERATLCPTCDIYLPEWSDQCYCCGWLRPLRANTRTALRHLMQSAKHKLQRKARPISPRVAKDSLCPTCEVCVPLSDPMCMICGWQPARKKSLRQSLGVLRAAGVRRALRQRQKRLRVCEHCDLPLLPGDALCMVCGWKPAPGAVQRLLAVRLRPRKAAVTGARQGLCPNCRTSLAEEAGRCGTCGWDSNPARSWARRPKMIWLVPICLVLYGTLMITLLQMADPLNNHDQVDRYGRTGPEDSPKQLTSARGPK